MTDDLAAQFALIAAHAPRLRSAGVQSLTIGDLSVVLLPPDPPMAQEVTDAELEEPRNALDDASTYGLPEDAEVPGFRRPDDLPRS